MTDYTPHNPDDPVSQGAGRAIAHLNADHDVALLDMARALAGCDEATAARCLDVVAADERPLSGHRCLTHETGLYGAMFAL